MLRHFQVLQIQRTHTNGLFRNMSRAIHYYKG